MKAISRAERIIGIIVLDMRERVEETRDEWDEHMDEWKFVFDTTPSSLGIFPVEALMKTELNYDAFLRSKGVDVDKIKRSQADVYNRNLGKACRISVGDLVYYRLDSKSSGK
eukprot:Awhi_evm1s5278